MMTEKNKFWAVVPAAGVGNRMESDIPKQYLSFSGKTVLEHTLERLLGLSLLESVVVVIAEGDPFWPTMPISQHPKIKVAKGGVERYQSVLSGLEELSQWADADDWVLVHDVARPCVRLSDVLNMVECVQNHAVGGLLGCAVSDTMKRADEHAVAGVSEVCREVLKTESRVGLWHAFTPQMFRLAILERALKMAVQNGDIVTDEASAVELLGYRPLMVPGARDNLKITYSEDLALAQYYLDRQAKNSTL